MAENLSTSPIYRQHQNISCDWWTNEQFSTTYHYVIANNIIAQIYMYKDVRGIYWADI